MNKSARNCNCFVPNCTNKTGIGKKFFAVPSSEKVRRKWFETVNKPFVDSNTLFICCQDHFDLDEDVSHQASDGKLTLRPGVLPKVDVSNKVGTSSSPLQTVQTISPVATPSKNIVLLKKFSSPNDQTGGKGYILLTQNSQLKKICNAKFIPTVNADASNETPIIRLQKDSLSGINSVNNSAIDRSVTSSSQLGLRFCSINSIINNSNKSKDNILRNVLQNTKGNDEGSFVKTNSNFQIKITNSEKSNLNNKQADIKVIRVNNEKSENASENNINNDSTTKLDDIEETFEEQKTEENIITVQLDEVNNEIVIDDTECVIEDPQVRPGRPVRRTRKKESLSYTKTSKKSIDKIGTKNADVNNEGEGNKVSRSGISPYKTRSKKTLRKEINAKDIIEDEEDDGKPRLVIIEQPASLFRFRYESESKGFPHGALRGESSVEQRKRIFPTVKLTNYQGEAIIRCWIFTDEPNPIPHIHKLVCKRGKKVYNEPHAKIVNELTNYTASFEDMVIFHEIVKESKERYIKKLKISGRYQQCEGRVTAIIKEMNKNRARLFFEAVVKENGKEKVLCSVSSRAIKNKKNAETGDLKIIRSSRCIGSVLGDDEVWLIVDKVTKDLKIKFYDDEGWSAYATLYPSDIHYAVTVIFKTPPYAKEVITDPVEVKYILERETDNEVSNPMTYFYLPRENKKRKFSDILSDEEIISYCYANPKVARRNKDKERSRKKSNFDEDFDDDESKIDCTTNEDSTLVVDYSNSSDEYY